MEGNYTKDGSGYAEGLGITKPSTTSPKPGTYTWPLDDEYCHCKRCPHCGKIIRDTPYRIVYS